MNHDKLVAQLKTDEGWRDKPYVDSLGNITIGYGHKGLHDVMLSEDNAISEEYGEQILDKDVAAHVRDMNILLPWWVNLDGPRQDALANMGFNLGVTKLMKFHKTLDFLKTGDFDSTSVEMLNSDWAKQVGNRALRLSLVIKTGVEDVGTTIT